MPTYQYECEACGHEMEVLQHMTDKKLTKCPKCNKQKLVRLIGSGSGMIFKGSGFYETDYKKKPVSTDSKPPDKTEAKPAAATVAPKSSCGSGCGCHPK